MALSLLSRFLDMAIVNACVIFVANNMSKNGIPQTLCSRINFIERLSFSLLEEHLKERAKIKNLLKNLKLFLSKYEETVDIYLASQKIKPGRDAAMNEENIEIIKQLFAAVNVMYLYAKNIALVKLHVTILQYC